MAETQAPVMTKTLRWCAGKFIYPRGSAELLHFMRLNRFIIDDALDFGHLFVLRALRVRADDRPLRDEELERWMKNTAANPVAELVAQVLRAQVGGRTRARVAELYPGVGCTYEYLKLLLERERRTPPWQLHYHACGPEAYRLKFEVLHADDPYTVDYTPDAAGADWLRRQRQTADVLVYNHDQAVRYGTETALDLDAFLEGAAAPAVLAARVTTAGEDRTATTVKGRVLRLPALARVRQRCLQADPRWVFQYVKEFDKEFFLPDGQGETGLLLGYASAEGVQVPGFGPAPAGA